MVAAVVLLGCLIFACDHRNLKDGEDLQFTSSFKNLEELMKQESEAIIDKDSKHHNLYQRLGNKIKIVVSIFWTRYEIVVAKDRSKSSRYNSCI